MGAMTFVFEGVSPRPVRHPAAGLQIRQSNDKSVGRLGWRLEAGGSCPVLAVLEPGSHHIEFAVIT